MVNSTSFIKLLIVSIVYFCFILSSVAPLSADNDLPLGDDGAQTKVQPLKKNLTLNKKSSKMVRTLSGDKYVIDKTTQVVDQNGKQIKIDYLRVPCDAELIYVSKADGSNFVYRIQVIKTHQKSTNRMDDPPK